MSHWHPQKLTKTREEMDCFGQATIWASSLLDTENRTENKHFSLVLRFWLSRTNVYKSHCCWVRTGKTDAGNDMVWHSKDAALIGVWDNWGMEVRKEWYAPQQTRLYLVRLHCVWSFLKKMYLHNGYSFIFQLSQFSHCFYRLSLDKWPLWYKVSVRSTKKESILLVSLLIYFLLRPLDGEKQSFSISCGLKRPAFLGKGLFLEKTKPISRLITWQN